MKIYKHKNSEIFDAYARQMLKVGSKKELLEELAEGGGRAIGEGLGIVPKVAPDVASAAAEGLAKAEGDLGRITGDLAEIRKSLEVQESISAVPGRYKDWTKERFYKAHKKNLKDIRIKKQEIQDQAQELARLSRLSETTLDEKAKLHKAYEDLKKAYADAIDYEKRLGVIDGKLDEVLTGLKGLEAGQEGLRAGQEGLRAGQKGLREGQETLGGRLDTVEGLLERLIEIVTKLSDKPPARLPESLDDIADTADDMARIKVLIDEAIAAGLESERKVMADALTGMRGQLDDLAKAVEKAAPGSKDEVMKAVNESIAKLEKKWAKQLDKAIAAGGKGRGKSKSIIWKWFMEPIAKGAGGATVTAASFVMLFGLIGGGVWLYLRSSEDYAAMAEKQVDDLSAAIKDAIRKVSPLAFNDLTEGEEQRANILDSLGEADAVVPELKTTSDKRRVTEIAGILEELYLDTSEFLTNSPAIKADLASPAGYQEALDSLYHLKEVLGDFKKLIAEAGGRMDDRGAGMEEGAGRGPGPVGRVAPGEAGEDRGDVPRVLIDVYDEADIDISHLKDTDRSAILGIVKKLDNPVFMAFFDPEAYHGNAQWGGKRPGGYSGNKRIDFLESLKWLSQRGITTPGALRREMKGELTKAGEKRSAGWRSAIRHYRKHGNKYLRKYYKSRKDAKKTANLDQSNAISINSQGIFMRKMADQFANSYYQDAVKGLGEQYAKSYYAGLKGMYEQNFGNNSEADYVKLYQTHDETGAQLIGNAHPQSVAVADAMGKGGLIENLLEQQRRNIGVTLSAPTGNFRARHAHVIESLVKLANEADEAGLTDASDLIDKTINNLLGD